MEGSVPRDVTYGMTRLGVQKHCHLEPKSQCQTFTVHPDAFWVSTLSNSTCCVLENAKSTFHSTSSRDDDPEVYLLRTAGSTLGTEFNVKLLQQLFRVFPFIRPRRPKLGSVSANDGWI